MPDADPGRPPRPSTFRRVARAFGRAVGDASLTIGIARGVTHGGKGGAQRGDDRLLSRAAFFNEGHRSYEHRSGQAGLLDRVPGWLLVAALIGIMVLAYATWGR